MKTTHNSADEIGDIVEIIRDPFTDIMKQLNGLRQVSHRIPDTHRTVNRLRQKQENTDLSTFSRTFI